MLIAVVDSNGNVVKVLGTTAGKIQVEAELQENSVIDVAQSYAPDLKCEEASGSAIKDAVELIDDVVETEDTGHSTGDKGVMLLAVRKDAAATMVTDDLDYSPIIVDANGRIHMIMVPDNTTDTKVTLDSEEILIGDISKGTQTNDVKITLDNENVATTEASASAIKTAAELIDDVIATHDSAATAKAAQIAAAYDSTKPTAVADGDAVRILADAYGRLLQGLEPEWFNAVYDSADATAEAEVVKAATSGKKIYITAFIISSDVEGWIKLQDEDSGALTGKFWLKAGGGVSWTAGAGAPLVLDTANKALEVIAEAAGDVSVTVCGYLAP